MRKLLLLITFIAIVLCSCNGDAPLPDGLEPGVYAAIQTSQGRILLQLEYEKTPMTTANFVGLAEGTLDAAKGNPFYDGLTFHRVVENFMIQSGDPKGDGTGGSGYTFPDEFDRSLLHTSPGTLSMANRGPGTNGSQFFITHVPTPHLDFKHTVFGHVIEGQDIVNSISQGDKIRSIRIHRIGDKAEQFQVTQKYFNNLVETAEERSREKSEAYRIEDLAIIQETLPSLKITESGIMYRVDIAGDGATPTINDSVLVNYTGQLLDDSIFDSTQGGSPAALQVNKVIPGWTEILLAMKEGEKRLIVLPPELGYGAMGYPGVIPPHSFLVFEIELIEILK